MPACVRCGAASSRNFARTGGSGSAFSVSRTEASRAAVALRPSFSVSVTRAGLIAGVLRAVIAGSSAIRTSGRSVAMTGSSSALSSISAKPRPPRAISTAAACGSEYFDAK